MYGKTGLYFLITQENKVKNDGSRRGSMNSRQLVILLSIMQKVDIKAVGHIVVSNAESGQEVGRSIKPHGPPPVTLFLCLGSTS